MEAPGAAGGCKPLIRGAEVQGAGVRGAGVRSTGVRGGGVRGAGVRGGGVRDAGVRGAGICFQCTLLPLLDLNASRSHQRERSI